MEIILNNRFENIDADYLTVSDLISLKNFSFKLLVVKVNGILVKKQHYGIQEIVEGDNVAIIHMISGG